MGSMKSSKTRDWSRWLPPVSLAPQPGALWNPAADVYRTEDGWLIKLELAGVQPKEIEVALAGRRLTVRGARRDCEVKDCGQVQSMEITYSGFSRTIDLPCEPALLQGARVETDYRDGMLYVRIRGSAR